MTDTEYSIFVNPYFTSCTLHSLRLMTKTKYRCYPVHRLTGLIIAVVEIFMYCNDKIRLEVKKEKKKNVSGNIAMPSQIHECFIFIFSFLR